MTEYRIPNKLVNLVRMSILATFNKVKIGYRCSEKFEVHFGFKKSNSHSLVLFNLALEHAVRTVCVVLYAGCR